MTQRRVDLIVVVDDSPSMRAHLPTMANNAWTFGDLFLDASSPDFRVVFTTTSVANSTCEGDRALGGQPVLDSCLAHLDDFIGPDEHGEHGGGELDLSSACTDWCSLDGIEVVPSYGSRNEGSLAPRPWIDSPRNASGTNLAEGVDYREAIGCAMMQGFGGCRFESPIEAAARMVERMADPQDVMFGFRRPDAILDILILSDEDDCSHPASSGTIFSPEGDKVFWPEGADEPLSAICVNAALECDGPEGACSLVDHALDGSPTTDPDAAVLTPTERLLAAFEAADEYNQGFYTPIVTAVGGFTNNGELYAHQEPPGGPFEDYAASFGVGPGCATPTPDELGRYASPGVRLDDLTQQVTPGNNFSLCNEDWTPAFTTVSETILPQQPPWCFPGEEEWACVDGLDDADASGEPDCVVEYVAGEFRQELPLCVRDAEGWVIDPATNDYALPEGEPACWVYALDQGSTADPNDDADDWCLDQDRRGTIKIARSPELQSSIPYDAYDVLRCRPC